MKKAIITIVIIAMTLFVVGCSSTDKNRPVVTGNGDIVVEDILVEEILVEEILVEEIR